MSKSDSFYAYEPPTSLWQLLESAAPPHELAEIKIILGESLVEQSIELHEEIELLLGIWREYREETQQSAACHNRLPEPPEARDMLKREISFFVKHISERAKENGNNPYEVLSKHNSEILDYVNESSVSSRPSTARSTRDGRETPMLGTDIAADRISLNSVVLEEFEAVNSKLSVWTFEEVSSRLQETLNVEIGYLVDDIEFLQKCLDGEIEFRCESSLSREPTLHELREERGKLEKTVLKNSPNMPSVSLKLSPSTFNKQVAFGSNYKTIESKSVKKTLPMKASHGITTEGSVPPEKPSETSRASRTIRRTGQFANRSALDPVDNKAQLKALSLTPNHITIKTGPMPPKTKLVKVSSVSTSGTQDEVPISQHIPSPPSSAKPTSRPGSASRFRKMVLECRDT